MQATRLSAGKYRVNGKTVNAVSADAAVKEYKRQFGSSQGNKSNGQNKGSPAAPKFGNKIDSVDEGLKAEDYVADKTAEENFKYNNPNQFGPLGSSVVTKDENGNVSINQTLDPNQQTILNQGSGLTIAGQELAKQRLGQFGTDFNPELAQRTSTGDLLADRQRIEDAVFGRLTRDVEKNRDRELADVTQTLVNRGIPLDPENPLYKRFMGDANQRFDDILANARGQAVQFGGDEMTRSFNQNEQLIANQLSQAGTLRQQNLAEIGGLQNMGTGLQMPQFQGYQGSNYQMGASPTQINDSLQGIDAAFKSLARPRGGGGGGAPAQPQSPFNSSPPPGLG